MKLTIKKMKQTNKFMHNFTSNSSLQTQEMAHKTFLKTVRSTF